MSTLTKTTPYWTDSASAPQFARLDEDLSVDVVVIGGGITGLTTAYLLALRARGGAARARPLRRQRHRAHECAPDHGDRHAAEQTLSASSAATTRRLSGTPAWPRSRRSTQIVRDTTSMRLRLGGRAICTRRSPASPIDGRALRDEAAAACEMGFDADFIERAPFIEWPGHPFHGQARFHPRKYLAGVARRVIEAGGSIFEHSEVGGIPRLAALAQRQRHRVSCADIVLATHNPLVGLRASLARRCSRPSWRSTALRRRGPRRRGQRPGRALLGHRRPITTSALSRSAITTSSFSAARITRPGRSPTPSAAPRGSSSDQGAGSRLELTHRWSGQVIETPDGLPYIGEMTTISTRQPASPAMV